MKNSLLHLKEMKTVKPKVQQTHQHLARASTEQKNFVASFSQEKIQLLYNSLLLMKMWGENRYFHIGVSTLMAYEDLIHIYGDLKSWCNFKLQKLNATDLYNHFTT